MVNSIFAQNSPVSVVFSVFACSIQTIRKPESDSYNIYLLVGPVKVACADPRGHMPNTTCLE